MTYKQNLPAVRSLGALSFSVICLSAHYPFDYLQTHLFQVVKTVEKMSHGGEAEEVQAVEKFGCVIF